MKNIAVILNGGKGLRFGENIPKQFTKLAGKTVIEYTIETFDNNNFIDEIIIVSNSEYIFLVEELILKNNFRKNIKIINGGKTRQESSYNAIKTLKGLINDDDNILFHDAVRPFISQEIINNIIESLKKYNAIDVAIGVPDTIIEVNEKNLITSIPNRNNLKRGQTPQGFKFGTIKKAHDLAIKNNFTETTDDCGLVLKFLQNEKIFVIDGSEKNIKITYPLDIYIANNLIQLGENIKNTNINTDLLKNKINIIFGHSSGIGKEIFEILKNNGIKVYGFSLSNGYDISNFNHIKKAFEEVYKIEGKIDNVIITAGILIKEKLETSTIENIIKQINVNYIGSVLISKTAIKYLNKTKGHILLFGSSSYSRGRSFYSIYSSTKSALINFTQALGEELINKGIKVNIINPERTLTKMRIQNFGHENPKTLLDPKNVAKISLNLLTTQTTGQILDICVKDFK